MQTLDLGISQDELRERVIERATERLVEYIIEGDIDREPLRQTMRDTIKDVAQKVADEEIRPWAEGQIENVILQRTNEWGEEKGEPYTFRQYLIKMAEEFMTETVNHNGKTKKEDSYNWRANTTRVSYLIDKHLQYHITLAMKEALETANGAIADGIEGAVKVSLQQVLAGIKTSVTVKR